MALRNQPYMPLYIQDYLTAEDLNMCSASSQGIFIKIMCQMHKSKDYGIILLKQKDKQNQSTYSNFAYKLAKLLPFEVAELKLAIKELVEETVLYIDGDKLCQKRMIRDNKISELRAESGSKGGKKTQSFAKAKSKAKLKQNTENANESEYESEIDNVNKGAYFQKWLDYRKELKKPITVKATLDSLVKTFNTEPIEKIKWVVNHSIGNGYQGLFWDKYKEFPQPKPKKRINHYVYKCLSCNKEFYPRVMKGENDFDAYRCDENNCQKVGLGKDGKNMVGYALKFIEAIEKE